MDWLVLIGLPLSFTLGLFPVVYIYNQNYREDTKIKCTYFIGFIVGCSITAILSKMVL